MNLAICDPPEQRNGYLTHAYLEPLGMYWTDKRIKCRFNHNPERIKDSVVLIHTDNLTPDCISTLKQNGNKIVGFSVTDSSHVSQCCRSGQQLQHIDLLFMLTGIQKANQSRELVIDSDFKLGYEPRQFLPYGDWTIFNAMRQADRILSLPYVHWERQPDASPQPYNQRSQKVLIRGGCHMRRFILCLFLLRIDRLDPNSGFINLHYAQEGMNPQFRYCATCRNEFRLRGQLVSDEKPHDCNSPAVWGSKLDLTDMGAWNNRCPASFYWLGREFSKRYGETGSLVSLLNARWMSAEEHLRLLSRITFTADLKWIHSIYAAQRFWDAANAGCINFLPERTTEQQYFPEMNPGEHYLTFQEDMSSLGTGPAYDEATYNFVSRGAKALYEQWIKPTTYGTNTNLLEYITGKITALQ